MELRPELLPPTVTPERVADLGAAIDRIAHLVLHGKRNEAAAAIAAFNTATGHTYSALDFAEYHGSRSRDAFAREAARPHRPNVRDISPAELAEILRRIQAADPDTDYYLRLFEANVADPNAADLIFHPPPHLEDAAAEEIVAAALAYRPFVL